jgi:hypothetical protein
MRPHPRIRKTAKWGGAIATALLVGVWIGSAWWILWWGSGEMNEAAIASGRLYFRRESSPSGAISFPKGWSLRSAGHASMDWSYEKGSGGTLNFGSRRIEITDTRIPLWIPVCIMLIPTVAAWRLDVIARRRAMPHLCTKCRYDRTGLAPGAVCPECGAVPE